MSIYRLRVVGTTYTIGPPGSRQALDAIVAKGARAWRVGPCEYEIAEPSADPGAGR